MLSASSGLLGGARGQLQLRQILVCFEADALVKPEVLVTFSAQNFDAYGQMGDPMTRKAMEEQMIAFKALLASHVN